VTYLRGKSLTVRTVPIVGERFIREVTESSIRGSGGSHVKMDSPVLVDVMCRDPVVVICISIEESPSDIISTYFTEGRSATEEVANV
jgi:hypothetical protein